MRAFWNCESARVAETRLRLWRTCPSQHRPWSSKRGGLMSDAAHHALLRRIDAVVNDAVADAARTMSDADREASFRGRSTGAYLVGEKNRALRDIFCKRTTEMAAIVSRAAHLDVTQKVDRLKSGAEEIAARL